MIFSNIKTSLIYFSLVIYLIFINLIGYEMWNKLITTIINPIFWLIIMILAIFINRNSSERIVAKNLKIQTSIIIMLIYLILYFLSGLFIGYAKSIYNHSFIGIMINIWVYISVIVSEEYVRNMFIRNNFNILGTIVILLLFILFDINIYSLLNSFTDLIEIFKQLSTIVIPAIALNMFMMYASKIGGFYLCITYRLPIILTNILLPIIPDLDWYFIAVTNTLLPFITFIILKNIHDKKTIRESKRFFKKYNPIKTIPFFIFLFIIIGFTAGIFKYKPVSIISNSMVPIFSRGDVVVYEKIDSKKPIKNYDIIVYKLDNITVIHRIIAIEKHGDGSVSYITKGDNNNVADTKKVDSKQLIGRVKFIIPKMGYPSIWLNEFFNKETVEINTGN